MTDTDREQKLQRLADDNWFWAETELHLIKTIQEHERKLAELPDIIRRLNEERERVTAEMLRTGAEHDALEAETRAVSIDKDFMDWANAQDADYADWAETVRRPNY